MKSTGARALEILEACGWTAGVVERTYRGGRQRFDLFGFADIVAVNPADLGGILFLQVTAAGDIARRVKKLLQEPRVITCLRSGGRVEVWGMRREPDRNGSMLLARALVWEDMNLRVVEGSLIVDA